ncbi:caspase family protein [Larkinella sp. GY13]|uniref:caspase family protein n=1 Tax=Larkinella sp. GY13 TaxID=3453720 RepID=UPI003EE9E52F
MIRFFLLILLAVLFSRSMLYAQTLMGTVYSYSDKTPLAGVFLMEKGTMNRTTTDSFGRYTLSPVYHRRAPHIVVATKGHFVLTYACDSLKEGDIKSIDVYLDKKPSLWNKKTYVDKSFARNIEKRSAQEENSAAPVSITAPNPSVTPSVLKNRYAFIVGNSGYLEGRGLEGRPLNDARDIAERLQTLGFTVTRHEDLADKQSFEKAFQQFNRTAKGADAALFFYAGHGIEVAGENYMIPTAAKLEQKEDVRYEAFPVSRVLDEFRELGAKNSIVLLDACRENPFRSWSRGEVNRGFKTIDLAQARIDNLFIGYATAPGSVAQNGTGRNGTFTMALLKFLRKGERFDDIFQDTTNEVMNRTDNAQRPFQTSSLRTKLIF